MSERVTMPALGESVTEGTVTRWLKQVGDTVRVDEPLLEVSTDKVDTEVPSPVSGTLQEILVPVDATVPVGSDLCVIGDGAAAPAPAAAPAAAAAPAVEAPVAPAAAPVAEPVRPGPTSCASPRSGSGRRSRR
jgi:2-oxoglutarate dehydrogenase E2 component (dihydrolipoamide succinyltransferase)